MTSVTFHQTVPTLLDYTLANAAADDRNLFHLRFDKTRNCSPAIEFQVHLEVSVLHVIHVVCAGAVAVLIVLRGRAYAERNIIYSFSKVQYWKPAPHLAGEGEWLREVEERAGESKRAL